MDGCDDLLRALPKVDEVLRRPEIAGLFSALPRWAVVDAIRREIERRRRDLREGRSRSVDVSAEDVARTARELARPSLRRVVNATGVVLHTNLGRAPLAERAATRVAELARAYTNLEYDVGERARGSRHDHLQALLADLTGAESSVVVNNNAAAVLLSLAALADGRAVAVSRGELIEIGGSFRIPDVMRWSGARLVEVGTTNKTHLRDYERALDEGASVLLKVHKSNFAMVGFVAEVPLEALVALGRARGVPVVVDLGSGTLVDPATWGEGLPHEPTVRQTVASGAALVTFSGDKLLGGPQAGIVVGTGGAVAKVRQHPLMRAVRPDKLTLAALEATLELYRAERAREVPVLRMLSLTPEELLDRARALLSAIGPLGELRAVLVETSSAVGGGALPTASPRSYAVALEGRSPDALDEALRRHDPPVVGRIADGRLLLDVRTLFDEELPVVAAAVRRLGRGEAGS